MAMKLGSIFTVDKDIYRVLIKFFLIVGKTKTTLFVYFSPIYLFYKPFILYYKI